MMLYNISLSASHKSLWGRAECVGTVDFHISSFESLPSTASKKASKSNNHPDQQLQSGCLQVSHTYIWSCLRPFSKEVWTNFKTDCWIDHLFLVPALQVRTTMTLHRQVLCTRVRGYQSMFHQQVRVWSKNTVSEVGLKICDIRNVDCHA